MRILLLPLALLALSGPTVADEFRIIKLEQDVRNLERQVQSLSREMNELRMHSSRGAEQPSSLLRDESVRPPSIDWLKASNWERIRPGMNELEVIQILGRPTSMRLDGERRMLMYAMEIGSDGFLSGSVAMEERKVVEVERPQLK